MNDSLPEHSRIHWMLRPFVVLVTAIRRWTDTTRFSIGVSGMLFGPDGRVLLLRHTFRHRHPWGVVSGWVSTGEEPADALRREIREETSVQATVGPILTIRSDPRGPSLEVVFIARLVTGSFRPSAETSEGRWIDPATDPLPEGLHPTHVPLIRAAVEALPTWRVNVDARREKTGPT